MLLTNATKSLRVLFSRIAAWKKSEIAGSPEAAAVAACYMASNIGYSISFISEYGNTSPFRQISLEQIGRWPDVTAAIVAQPVAERILEDRGKINYFKDEQEVWDRNLVNVWRVDV